MKIYDEGLFFSHLEMEISKTKRFGYPFTVIAVKAQDIRSHKVLLLTAIFEAHFRATDIVALTSDGYYLILLNGTEEKKAQIYLSRLIQKAVSDCGIPIITAMENLVEGDDRDILLSRLINKIK